MLKELLENKKCFKLICGAGNENLDEVEKLVAIYAAAGCHFFDLCASEEVLKAAQKGLRKGIITGLDLAGSKESQKDCHFCVSIGTKNDPHFNKAKINSDKCKRCEKCIKICPQGAISNYFKVIEKNCIGCLKCKSVCGHGAIESYSKDVPLNFSFLQSFNIDCIELHVSEANDALQYGDFINKNFDGFLSICIGRSSFENEAILRAVKHLISQRKPYTTIIQADGEPMSGGEDDFKTTLQAVAMAEIIEKEELPVYIIPSGGTNSKTAQLANLCGVNIHGVAIGSYARKIVKEYIERDDFFENKMIFDKACGLAKRLVESM